MSFSNHLQAFSWKKNIFLEWEWGKRQSFHADWNTSILWLKILILHGTALYDLVYANYKFSSNQWGQDLAQASHSSVYCLIKVCCRHQTPSTTNVSCITAENHRFIDYTSLDYILHLSMATQFVTRSVYLIIYTNSL